VLGTAQRRFVADLPLTLSDEDRLYVHAEASSPKSWIYVMSAAEATASLLATSARITFCGHTHEPMLYSMSATAKTTPFAPVAGVAIPLLSGRRWRAVLGAVGQPRDGNPAASYAVLDSERHELTYYRAPYSVEEAAAQIRKNHLPPWFAQRLFVGR
jgi:diadenosine tetraphosphatase ApaH/serine/threonine PP2A family protein phosphatase